MLRLRINTLNDDYNAFDKSSSSKRQRQFERIKKKYKKSAIIPQFSSNNKYPQSRSSHHNILYSSVEILHKYHSIQGGKAFGNKDWRSRLAKRQELNILKAVRRQQQINLQTNQSLNCLLGVAHIQPMDHSKYHQHLQIIANNQDLQFGQIQFKGQTIKSFTRIKSELCNDKKNSQLIQAQLKYDRVNRVKNHPIQKIRKKFS